MGLGAEGSFPFVFYGALPAGSKGSQVASVPADQVEPPAPPLPAIREVVRRVDLAGEIMLVRLLKGMIETEAV